MSAQCGSGSTARISAMITVYGDAQAPDAAVRCRGGPSSLQSGALLIVLHRLDSLLRGVGTLRLVRPQQQHFAVAVELRQRLRFDQRERVGRIALDFRHRARPGNRPGKCRPARSITSRSPASTSDSTVMYGRLSFAVSPVPTAIERMPLRFTCTGIACSASVIRISVAVVFADLHHLADDAERVEHRLAEEHAVVRALVDDAPVAERIDVDADDLRDQRALADARGRFADLAQPAVLLVERIEAAAASRARRAAVR